MSRKPPKKFIKKPGHYTEYGSRQINLLRKAVMDTLRYRQIFDSPLSYFQIWNYLIGGKETVDGDLQKELNALVQEKKIFVKDGLYSLQRIDQEKAEKRRKRSAKLLVKFRSISGYLKKLPWIEMLAVTGSVAAFNADEEGDIDVFVVTRPRRLFLSRLYLVLVLKALGVYWNPKKPAGTVCPNIMLTSGKLKWERSGQNLYTANEIALLYPVFYRHNCYFDFLKANSWAAHHLPNLQIPDHHTRHPKNPPITGKLLDLIEILLMKVQMFYMKNKRTTEIISEDLIHFNTHDISPEILSKFHDTQITRK